MTTVVLTLIERMQADIASMGRDTAYQYMSRADVQRFGEQLESFEPFKTIAESWLVFPLGGGRTGKGVSGVWAWHQLLFGVEPRAIAAAASKFVAENRYDALEVRVVKGIAVSKARRLSATASLVPNETLAKEWPHNRVFGNDMLGERFPTTTAALVQEFVVEPAMLPLSSEHREIDPEQQHGRDAYAARMRLAFGLAAGGPVEMPHSYAQLDRRSILHGAGVTLSHKPTMSYFGIDVEVDVDAALKHYRELEAMKAPRALELSIDRLLRSRLSRSLEDRIIDLGMAAEIALMHNPKGTGDGKSEITNKIASRGAWLLARDASERLSISRTIEELYNARSKVVHTGEASGKLQSRIAEFDATVVRIALALMSRGAFPDWKSLVLGGDACTG